MKWVKNAKIADILHFVLYFGMHCARSIPINFFMPQANTLAYAPGSWVTQK